MAKLFFEIGEQDKSEECTQKCLMHYAFILRQFYDSDNFLVSKRIDELSRSIPDAFRSLFIWKQAFPSKNKGQCSIGLVLGMHRSGTSCLTGYLHGLGYNHAGKLLPANDGNPRGYHESAAIVEANQRLLTNLTGKRSWKLGTDLMISGSSAGAAITAWHSEIAELISAYAGDSPLIIKDPRLCVLIRYIPEWFQSDMCDWHFYILLRDPLSAAQSLAARGKASPLQATRMWINYTLQAERHTRNLPRIFIPFPELVFQREAWENRILRFMEWQQIKVVRESRSGEEVDPSLVHFKPDAEATEPKHRHSKGLAIETEALALELYETLKIASQDGSSPPLGTLDNIRERFILMAA
jgi:hypothetical protein